MVSSQEIVRAIGAHGIWKRRLAEAIRDGAADISAEQVEVDNRCDFGKWLYSLPQAERSSTLCKKVQALHAAFHKEAAKVLTLALGGRRAEAEQCMAEGGSFAEVSMNLTEAMMAWNTAIRA